MTTRGFGFTTAAFLAALFLGIGIHQPFFPLWLQGRGLSAAEIAVILAAPVIRIVAAPAIAFVADRLGTRKTPIVVLCGLTLAGFVALGLVDGFGPILIVSILMAIVWPSIIPLAEAAAVSGSIDRGIDYGRVRLWGSLAFIGGSLATGAAVGLWSSSIVLWLLIGAQAVVLATSLALPGEDPKAVPEAGRGARLPLGEVARLFRGRVFVLLLVATGLTQAAHAMYYAFGAIHWRGLGIDESVIGLLWATGVVGEVALFAVSDRMVRRFGPGGLIILGAGAAIVRWSVTAMDPPIAVLFVAQALHALTFGATHLGTVHFIFRAVPRPLQGTGQGLYSAVSSGILLSGTVALCGPAYQVLGGGTYLLMAAMGLGALACALVLSRWWDGGPLTGISPRGRPPEDA